MNAPAHLLRSCRRVAVGLLWTWPLISPAQWAPEVETMRRFRLRAVETSMQLRVEAESDQRTNRGEPIRRDYLFIEPMAGFNLIGSIYHPNLVNFYLRPEFGPSWQAMRLIPPDGIRTAQRWLHHYEARFNILREKPFATHLFAERGFSYRDLDFFNRARVDSVRYGIDTGYTTAAWPFKIEASHLSETVAGDLGRATDVTDNIFSLSANHTANGHHKSNFSYQLNQFNRAEAGLTPTAGSAQNATFLDQNAWGADQWISLNSSGLVTRLNTSNSQSRSLTLLENLDLQLRPNLSAEGHYDFSDQLSDQVGSRSHDVRAAIRHQLFKSLISTLAVQGSSLATRSPGASLDHRSVGLAVDEHYTKRLPAHGTLNVSANWRGDRQQRRTAGEVLRIADEALTVNDRQPAFLSQSEVLDVGRVTNAVGAAFTEGLDYVLVRHDRMVEVRRVSGGNIPDGSQVMVDYTATALPTDNYLTQTRGYDARLEFFDGIVALYGRLNQMENLGGRSVVLRNLADQVAGAEISWRWFRAGAEEERLDSNLSPYVSRRTFQGIGLDLGHGSAVTLNLDESVTTFTDTGLTRKSRSLVGRLQHQWTTFLTWQVEAGVRRERGLGINQDRTAIRTSFAYTYGKLKFELSYNHDNEDLLGELHRRQHATLRCRRSF